MSRPIRVLELRSVRGTGGGPEKTILLGTARTDPSRYAITVCYLRDRRDPEFTIDERARQLGVDYVEVLERHSYDPAIWTQLRRLVRTRGVDIIHAHDYKTNLLARLLARGTIRPLSTVHGWFGLDTGKERVYYAADRRVLRTFPKVIAVSGVLKRELVAAGVRSDRVAVVPNGIDAVRFRRDDAAHRREVRTLLGLSDTAVVVGAVGRLERQKRFDLLIETVAGLRDEFPDLRLLIAGDGSLRHALDAQIARSCLEGVVKLLGHQTDIVRLHHAFDLFVQASDEEGSPNVVLEAMALETPAIVTDVGGTADLIEHGVHGLLIPAGNRDALRTSLRDALLNWPETLRRRDAARARVEAELSFDRRMGRVEAIYDELMMR
jgi:glycosyltransferase involved in cell wall biosynthesis